MLLVRRNNALKRSRRRKIVRIRIRVEDALRRAEASARSWFFVPVATKKGCYEPRGGGVDRRFGRRNLARCTEFVSNGYVSKKILTGYQRVSAAYRRTRCDARVNVLSLNYEN